MKALLRWASACTKTNEQLVKCRERLVWIVALQFALEVFGGLLALYSLHTGEPLFGPFGGPVIGARP